MALLGMLIQCSAVVRPNHSQDDSKCLCACAAHVCRTPLVGVTSAAATMMTTTTSTEAKASIPSVM